jgi:hypothetical protein
MTRPTRKHPLLRLFDSPECFAMVEQMAVVLGGFEYEAVDQVGKVTVFRIDGPSGSGLLAERSQAVPERPGVYVASESAWVRAAGHQHSWVFDARLHSWDAGTEALVTGDRSIVEGPKRRMYRIRDERSAEAAKSDSLAVGELPPDAVPGFIAGVAPATVRALAIKHAPELLA